MIICAVLLHLQQKQPNLKLKTQPKQLLGYLPLAFALSGACYKERSTFRAWLYLKVFVVTVLLAQGHSA